MVHIFLQGLPLGGDFALGGDLALPPDNIFLPIAPSLDTHLPDFGLHICFLVHIFLQGLPLGGDFALGGVAALGGETGLLGGVASLGGETGLLTESVNIVG